MSDGTIPEKIGNIRAGAILSLNAYKLLLSSYIIYGRLFLRFADGKNIFCATPLTIDFKRVYLYHDTHYHTQQPDKLDGTGRAVKSS